MSGYLSTLRPKIKVPDIEDPALCFKQKLDPPNAMVRCNRKKGHKGKHSWQKRRKQR